MGKKRKNYVIPKALLEHYCGYFENHFRHGIKRENADQIDFYFLDDDPDDFGLIVTYIFKGSMVQTLPEPTAVLKMERCLNYTKLTGKFGCGEAASVIYPVLKEILVNHVSKKDPTELIKPEFIRTAFSIIPARNKILELLCQAALPETMKRDGGKYGILLKDSEEFLAETLRQFHACRPEISLLSPLNKKVTLKV